MRYSNSTNGLTIILQNREKKGKMGKMIYKFNNASLKFITFVLKVWYIQMCSDKISRIIGILTTYIIACYRELRDMAHHVSASVLSKTICAAIGGVMAFTPISATEENDSIKITPVATSDSFPNINDSIIKHPYF